MESRSKSSLYIGAIFIVLGLLFLFNNAGIIKFDFIFDNFWPLLLITVGGLIIYNSNRKKESYAEKITFGDRSDELKDDYINASVTFGDYKVAVDSQNFKGGRLRTTFGELHVDLTKAKLDKGQNLLNLDVTFGEIVVSLPKDCPVRISASVVAGDIKLPSKKWDGINKRAIWQSESYDSAEAKLDITCNIVFGEIKVW